MDATDREEGTEDAGEPAPAHPPAPAPAHAAHKHPAARAASAADAYQRIAKAGARFVSRGDNSGTHAQELKLWKAAGIVPEGQSWYQQTGLGMGQTLAIAAEKKAYTLSDRGTYLALQK